MIDIAELHIRLRDQELKPDAVGIIEHFAEMMECDLAPVEAGWLLLPEIMLRKYGVFVFPTDEGYKVCREEDATTWEDFLMVKLAHMMADTWEAELWLWVGRDEQVAVAPHKFETFDHYVETVLERESELVRDMKKYWLYAHRKRSLR